MFILLNQCTALSVIDSHIIENIVKDMIRVDDLVKRDTKKQVKTLLIMYKITMVSCFTSVSICPPPGMYMYSTWMRSAFAQAPVVCAIALKYTRLCKCTCVK